MNRVSTRLVSRSERRWLHRAKRQRSNHTNASHARIILLASGGIGNREIAKLIDFSPNWVRTVIHRFNQHGVDGIQWCPECQVRGPRKFFQKF